MASFPDGYDLFCFSCKADITVDDPWQACKDNVKCPHCGVENEVYIDEDIDCNYWFGTEPPTSKTKELKS